MNKNLIHSKENKESNQEKIIFQIKMRWAVKKSLFRNNKRRSF
jgi:hypothetical protein